MKIAIVEDERLSAEKLQKMLSNLRKNIEITAILTSIKETIDFLNSHQEIDLIFMDIHLSDGNSFSIFEEININIPIIFTTAFDEYAIKAFKVSSIDYLLKPIDIDDLENALDKYEKFVSRKNNNSQKYKSRFLLKKGNQFEVINTKKIAYIYSEKKITQLITFENKRYILDQSLDNILQQLDPVLFFRINRQMIISIQSITEIHTHFNSRLKLQLTPSIKEDIFVSRERVNEFKKWLDG